MKKSMLIILTLITGMYAKAQFIKAELQASGLTCSMCSFATQKQLKTLSYIDSIGVNLDNTTFMLFFKKNASFDPMEIKKKVEDAGFSVAALYLTYHFENVKIDNNSNFDYQTKRYHFIDVKPQLLNGDVKLKVIDKGFISTKEFKKYKKIAVEHICFINGKVANADNVNHLTIQ